MTKKPEASKRRRTGEASVSTLVNPDAMEDVDEDKRPPPPPLRPPPPKGSGKEEKRAAALKRQQAARIDRNAKSLEAAAQVNSLLIQAGLSKAHIKETLGLLAAQYGLQTVPLRSAPVVLSAQQAAPESRRESAPKKERKAPRPPRDPPAVWKKDPECLRILSKRDSLVAAVKGETDQILVDGLRKEIAALNAALKSAKEQARKTAGQ